MTNPKTDHKNSKPTPTPHLAARRASAAPERQTNTSTAMIEACDRLGQKMDQVASLVQEQIEAWKQIREPAASEPAPRETAATPGIHPITGPALDSKRSPAELDIEPDKGPEARVQDKNGGPSMVAVAEDARRLVDTLSRSRNDGQEQMAGVQQALEAIMAFLESQAANIPPKVDVEEIMSRLRNLQEQQQTLQSQFNNNRWGP